MEKKLFVGNIDWNATEEDLQQLFAEFGAIEEVVIIKDKFTGRSKGFGFVTYEDEASAEKAISAVDGQDLKGRPLAVNEARPQQDRAPQGE